MKWNKIELYHLVSMVFFPKLNWNEKKIKNIRKKNLNNSKSICLKIQTPQYLDTDGFAIQTFLFWGQPHVLEFCTVFCTLDKRIVIMIIYQIYALNYELY